MKVSGLSRKTHLISWLWTWELRLSGPWTYTKIPEILKLWAFHWELHSQYSNLPWATLLESQDFQLIRLPVTWFLSLYKHESVFLLFSHMPTLCSFCLSTECWLIQVRNYDRSYKFQLYCVRGTNQPPVLPHVLSPDMWSCKKQGKLLKGL